MAFSKVNSRRLLAGVISCVAVTFQVLTSSWSILCSPRKRRESSHLRHIRSLLHIWIDCGKGRLTRRPSQGQRERRVRSLQLFRDRVRDYISDDALQKRLCFGGAGRAAVQKKHWVVGLHLVLGDIRIALVNTSSTLTSLTPLFNFLSDPTKTHRMVGLPL